MSNSQRRRYGQIYNAHDGVFTARPEDGKKRRLLTLCNSQCYIIVFRGGVFFLFHCDYTGGRKRDGNTVNCSTRAVSRKKLLNFKNKIFVFDFKCRFQVTFFFFFFNYTDGTFFILFTNRSIIPLPGFLRFPYSLAPVIVSIKTNNNNKKKS